MDLLRTKNIEAMIALQRGNGQLRRSLTALDLVLLGVGAIIGTGIFVLTGTGAMMAGPALPIAFVIAGIACCLSAFAYAEFASSIPVAGSIYTYSYATLGELVAWFAGWVLMLEYGLVTATVAVGWSGYFQGLLAGLGVSVPVALSAAPGAIPGVATLVNLPALIIVLLIAGLLTLGVKRAAWFNNAMVAIKISVILIVVVVGARYVKPENWHPYMPFGWQGVFGAAAIMFFSFIGFDAVSAAAEEVKNPKRDLPIGIIVSLALCTLLYVVVAAVMTGMTPYSAFAGVANPVSMALTAVGEDGVAAIIDVGAVVGMITVMLVMAYGHTRIIFAMSRDGLLPAPLARVHPRFATPHVATCLVGVAISATAAFVPLRVLAELANFGTLTAFALVSIAVIVLRRTRPDLPRAFRCPGMPFIPMLAALACIFLLLQLQSHTWLFFGVWVAIGTLIYFFYSRSRSKLNQS